MARKVKCKFCGKSFELQRKNYKLGNRYVCGSCAQQYNSRIYQAQRENNLRRFGMRQSWGTMFLKLFLGIFILVGMFTDESLYSPILLVIAIILLLSAIIPFLRRKKVKRNL